MAEIHYKVANEIYSTSVDQSNPVLVAIPGTKEFRVTPTYANQVLPEHQIVMELGNPKGLVSGILSKIGPDFRNTLEEERLSIEMEIESLDSEVKTLTESRASRAKPFLEYANEKVSISPGLREKIQNGYELTKEDVNMLASPVYRALEKAIKLFGEEFSFLEKVNIEEG